MTARVPLSLRLRGLLSRPLVTVVVPVHDTAAYVLDCLRSLEADDVPKHVVIVDDGSTDESPAIVRAWAQGRPGAEVLTQQNRGPGAGGARNAGLALVRTPWVMFLDSDDTLEPGGLAALLAAARHSRSDLVVGRVQTMPEPRRWVWDEVFANLDHPVTVPVESVPTLVHNPAPGNKLYRTAALRGRGLTFAEGIHHQDTVVTIPTLLLSPTVTVCPDLVLNYRRHEASVMGSHFVRRQNYLDHLTALESLAPLRDRLPAERRVLLDTFCARSMQGFVLRAPEVLEPAPLEEFTRRARALFVEIDPATIAAATASVLHRLAYARLLEVPGAPSEDTPPAVHPVDGAPWAGPVPHPLLRLGRVVARATRARDDAGDLLLEGTLEVEGGAPVHALAGAQVSLRVRGAGVTVPVTVGASTSVAASDWSARLPATGLLSGRYRLRLVLQTAGGALSTGVRAPREGAADLPGSDGSSVQVLKEGGVLELAVTDPERGR